MAQATSVSDLERAEHLNYADGKGVKRVSMYNNGVQVNAATADNQTNGNQKTQIVNASGTTISSITHGDMTHLAVDHEDLTLTDTISGLNDSSVLDTHGVGSVIVLVSGTWQGKIDIQGTIDGTWVTLSIVQPTGQLIRTGINNDAQNGSYRVALPAGYSSIRAVFTSWTSGTAGIKWNASQAVGANFVFQLNQANLLTTAYQATATNLNANVTSNGSNLATAANQTNGNQKAQIVQTVVADANNSSTTNLSGTNSYTFTGTSSSTLGIAGIQVSLFANKNCIIKVQQSPDTTPNWDLTDTYYYTANSNFGVTVQAISSYVRVVVTTMSETTTTFRLQTALCPIVEAVPRSLDANGNLKVALQQDLYGNGGATFTPNYELNTSPRFRLIGTQFEGSTLDSQFWSTQVATGTVTLTSSNIILASGTADTHYARLYSNRRARYVSGSTNKFRCHLRLEDTGTANVKRRWGIVLPSSWTTFADADGAWFQLNGTTFSVVTSKGGSETTVSSGSFNGQLGYTYAPTLNNTVYEILYTNGSVSFIVGGVLLHKITASLATWTNTMNLHAFTDVVNSGASAVVSHYTRTINISRLGQLLTQPQYYYFAAGTTAGVQLKIGAGNLHSMILNNVVNNSVITLADSTTTTTPAIFVHTAGATATGVVSIDFKGIPFSSGLRLIVATQNASVTVVYE